MDAKTTSVWLLDTGHYYDIIHELIYYYALLVIYLLLHTRRRFLGSKLLDASFEGDVEEVTKLLKQGAPLSYTNDEGWTALHVACADKNKPELVKVLLTYNPDVNLQHLYGNTPVHLACGWGFLDSLKLLLATGKCDLGKCVCMCVWIWDRLWENKAYRAGNKN